MKMTPLMPTACTWTVAIWVRPWAMGVLGIREQRGDEGGEAKSDGAKCEREDALGDEEQQEAKRLSFV